MSVVAPARIMSLVRSSRGRRAMGGIGSVLLLVLTAGFRRTGSLRESWSSEVTTAMSSSVGSRAEGAILGAVAGPAHLGGVIAGPVVLAPNSRRATAVALLAGVL